MQLSLWHVSFIYFVIFLGTVGITELIVNFALNPLIPQLLESAKSPNYMFIPALIGPLILRIIALAIAVYFATRTANMLLPTNSPRKIASIATILYILVTLLPAVRFFLMSQDTRDLLQTDSSYVLSSLGVNGIFFVIFYALSSYWLHPKKLR